MHQRYSSALSVALPFIFFFLYLNIAGRLPFITLPEGRLKKMLATTFLWMTVFGLLKLLFVFFS